MEIHDWQGFPGAPGAAAAAGIVLLTFVSEDAATIGSALLALAGSLEWPLAFASCFLGIWIGDMGLYKLARGVGRPLIERFTNGEALLRAERWFAKGGSLALVASRFIPGTRLPTFVAAGVARMPFGKFALITGVVALVWVALAFSVTRWLGAQALGTLKNQAGALGLTALAVVGTLHLARRARISPTLRRWSRWEFWPSWLFYIPVGVYYLWLGIRHRDFSLPTVANPGITHGGIVGESKFAMLRELQRTSPEFVAEAWLIGSEDPESRVDSMRRLCTTHSITLPFIVKPDVGQRGAGVKVIRSFDAAEEYLRTVRGSVVLQRYAPGPREIGVFYHRFPNKTRGHIFAITEKIFPEITGDGIRTVEQLIRSDARAGLIARTYLRRWSHRRDEVLRDGERLKLVEAGNHAQGCIFQEGMHLHSPELARRIDSVSCKIQGFHVGRYDIRYGCDDDLQHGRNFQIVELNGAASEATSIYDARNSLYAAYRTLFRQWSLVFRIGAANRALGHSPSPLMEIWKEWRHYARQSLSYPCAD